MVPALDSELYIADGIESVLAQTHRPLEVLVIDDSTGGATAEIARGYGEPVRLLRGEAKGPAAARNFGVAAARADLIAFNDADDVWHPEKLARQAAHLRQHPHLGGCVTNLDFFWEKEVEWEREALRGTKRAGVVPGWATITLLARRQAFEKTGPLDEERIFSDSADWFLRARDAGVEIDLLEEVLVHHRRRGGSLSRRAENEQEFLVFLRERIAQRREGGQAR